jgi:murein DD-endopeptidase MepM/ murein hydrolase activator NlpD
MRARILLLAAALAATTSLSMSTASVQAIYCYPGDPPDVYKACVDYNNGIGQQVNNTNQLLTIQSQINDALAQINAIDALIASLKNQIAAQQALIDRTQKAIDDLSAQIRFGEAALIELKAHVAVRQQVLDQRLRYIDSHGTVNYVQLVLTSSSINQLMDRMVGAQQVATSDRRLLNDLAQEHARVAQATSDLEAQRVQVRALLQQQQATKAELEKNLKAQNDAIAAEEKLQAQLKVKYDEVQAARAAIDANVAKLAQQYDAAAAKYGGGNGVFEWPVPACGPSCITQGFGCSSFYLEVYDASCPWPHKIHTGIDIAGPYGTQIVAADTGIVYLYPGSIGYGNLLVMYHGNGYETYYGHLQGYVSGMYSGKVVARGDAVAYEGSTGWSTGPHLHFEIRYQGAYKDPCVWLGC